MMFSLYVSVGDENNPFAFDPVEMINNANLMYRSSFMTDVFRTISLP